MLFDGDFYGVGVFELCLDPDLVYSLFSIFPDMKRRRSMFGAVCPLAFQAV